MSNNLPTPAAARPPPENIARQNFNTYLAKYKNQPSETTYTPAKELIDELNVDMPDD